MKKPMYALLVAPEKAQRSGIISGKVFAIVLEGWLDFQNGPVMLCCNIEPWAVMADVTGVRHTNVAETTEEIARAAGFDNKQELWDELWKCYPKLQVDSPVTVIRWQNVQGKLVDEYAAEESKRRKLLDGVCEKWQDSFTFFCDTGEMSVEFEMHVYNVCQDGCWVALERYIERTGKALESFAKCREKKGVDKDKRPTWLKRMWRKLIGY